LLYDNFSKELIIGIPNTLNDKMLVLSNLTFFDHYVSCQFYQNGQYSLNFSGTAEYCTNSLTDFSNSYCDLSFTVNLSVEGQGNQINVLYIVIGVLSFLIFVGLLSLFIFLCVKKRCCRCSKKRSKSLDKTVYIEAPKMNKVDPDEVIEVNMAHKCCN